MKRKYGTVVEPVNKQTGLSIIEIMVALLLSSLLTLGLVQVFTSNSQSFRLNEANSRVQETGRIALELLSRAVRNAGYYGCQPPGGFTNNLDIDSDDFDENVHDFDQSRAVFSGESGRPADALDDTDYIRVAGLAGDDLDLKTDGPTASNEFTLEHLGQLKVDDVLFITDCKSGDIVQIGELKTSNLIELSGGALSAGYLDGTRVMKGAVNRYSLKIQADHNEPALYRNSDAFVSGIERMQVQYGTGINKTVTDWQKAEDMAASDWSNVLAARISILVRSATDNVVVEPQKICFPGPTWDGQDCDNTDNLETMPDRRLYRVYTTTAAVRNRVQ